jgi:hypothetical protein
MTSGTDWIDQAQRLVEAVRGGLAGGAPAGGDRHSADCRWCPICTAAAVVRGERPEVTAALADVLTAAAAALRTIGAAGQPHVATPEAEPGPPQSESPPVQRIDIA